MTDSSRQNEVERLAALHSYEVLDTPPDGAFDRITALAARHFHVPVALVSLVDEDRIWFKSRHGLEAEQIPRSPGLCASGIFSDEAYVVLNALEDPRTLGEPFGRGGDGGQVLRRGASGDSRRVSAGHDEHHRFQAPRARPGGAVGSTSVCRSRHGSDGAAPVRKKDHCGSLPGLPGSSALP